MAGSQQKIDVATQRIADAMGEDVSLTHGKVQIGLAELGKQVQKLVESHGQDFHQFSAWAQKSHADTAAAIMVRHMSGSGKVSEVWGPLVGMYASKGGSKA